MPGWLITFLNITVVMEISVVNLVSFNQCVRRKYSQWFTLLILLLSAVVITGGGFAVVSMLPIYGNGNGFFVLFGFFYLIPLRFLYQADLKRICIVICSAWVYTLCVFSVSVQLGGFFDPGYFSLAVLCIQTVIFGSSAFLFFRFMRWIYAGIFGSLDERTQKYLSLTSFSWFVAILLIHFGFVTGQNDRVFNILTVALMLWCAGITYYLLFRIVTGTARMKELRREALSDALTGVPNRNSFIEDIAGYLDEGAFCVLFFDLDHFKCVNDEFGHVAGDEYLKTFATVTRGVVAGCGGEFYRIAGDEFLALIREGDASRITEEIREANEAADFGVPFLGVCIGALNVENGADWSARKILLQVDQMMYREKKQKYAEE